MTIVRHFLAQKAYRAAQTVTDCRRQAALKGNVQRNPLITIMFGIKYDGMSAVCFGKIDSPTVQPFPCCV
jgi:hypothetical protein